ncbi:MAG TPA: hypothetical protein VLG38_01740 [Gammaproteobacteria bacterium]|nr:hypothetical protein [Gammaproteobacteria bacterium]
MGVINKAAGETYVTNVKDFQMNSGSLTVNYMDSRGASVDRRQRIELLDLKDQREGEAHIFFKSRIVRAEFFHANPKPVKKLRVGVFLKVEPPPVNELQDLGARLNKAAAIFKNQSITMPNVHANEDISILANAFAESYSLRPMERGFAGLISILEHDVAAHQSVAERFVPQTVSDNMSIFTQIEVTPTIEKMIGQENTGTFSTPLLRADTMLKDLEGIERLSGTSESNARVVAQNLLGELERTTMFPGSAQPVRLGMEQLLTDVNRLLMHLGGSPYTPPMTEMDLPPLPELPELPELTNLPDVYDYEQSNVPNMYHVPEHMPDPDMEQQIRSLDLTDIGLHDLPSIDTADEAQKIEEILNDELLKTEDTVTDDE